MLNLDEQAETHQSQLAQLGRRCGHGQAQAPAGLGEGMRVSQAAQRQNVPCQEV